MVTLHGIASSGNTYRVRLMLALIRLPYAFAAVTGHDALATPAFRALNPFGEAPVLVDGDVVLRDSQAILVYLARRDGRFDWLPEAAPAMAAVCQWLSFAANEIQNGPRMARAITRGIVAGDLAAAHGRATRAVRLLDARLRGRAWLETERATIADIACYPYIFNAEEGGVETAALTGLRAWLARIEALDGFVAMDALAA
jgi:glutathione S-transferase